MQIPQMGDSLFLKICLHDRKAPLVVNTVLTRNRPAGIKICRNSEILVLDNYCDFVFFWNLQTQVNTKYSQRSAPQNDNLLDSQT